MRWISRDAEAIWERNAKSACNFCFAQAAVESPPHNQPSDFSQPAVQEMKSHDGTLESSHVQAQQQCGTAVPATQRPQRISVCVRVCLCATYLYKSAKVNSELVFLFEAPKRNRRDRFQSETFRQLNLQCVGKICIREKNYSSFKQQDELFLFPPLTARESCSARRVNRSRDDQ